MDRTAFNNTNKPVSDGLGSSDVAARQMNEILLTRIGHLLRSLFCCINPFKTRRSPQRQREGCPTSHSQDVDNIERSNGSMSVLVEEFSHEDDDHSYSTDNLAEFHRNHQDEYPYASKGDAMNRLLRMCEGKYSFSLIELEFILHRYPDLHDPEREFLPLHVACRNNAPISVIRALLKAWPNAVQTRSSEGTLPLHEACFWAKSLKTLQLLIEAYPNSIKQGRYRTEKLFPLHIALRNFAVPIDVIRYLVEQWPASVKVRIDEMDKFALHCACENGLSLSVIRFLVEQWPFALRTKSEFGLPLHYACRQTRSSSDTIAYLIDTWPDSIKVFDNDSCLPLRDACIHHAQSSDIIQLLIDKWPGAASVANPSDGCWPLHLACREKASLAVLKLLIKTWPSALREKDNKGRLPLHYICEHNLVKGSPCLEKVQLMVKSWPRSLQIRTSDGSLPLHTACSCSQATEVMRYLVESYPQAVHIPDCFRRSLLHIACKSWFGKQISLQQLETIDYLVRAWPESVQRPYSDLHQDDSTGQIVLDVACDQCKSPSTKLIHLLTRGNPPLHYVCANECTLWMPTRLQTIAFLSSLYPDEMMRFHNGMLPIHVACRARAPRAVLECLVQQCPQVIHMVTKDMKDSLLHCYFSSTRRTTSHDLHLNWSWSTITYLVEVHPEALNYPNRRGWLPIHIAAMHDAPLDMLFYLATRCPLF